MAGGGDDVGGGYGGDVWGEDPEGFEEAGGKTNDGSNGGGSCSNDGLVVAVVKNNGDKGKEWRSQS